MKKVECPRCSGQGFIRGFSHVENGRCFLCRGAKVVSARMQTKPESKKTRWLVGISQNVDNPFVSFLVANLVEVLPDGGQVNIKHFKHYFESTDHRKVKRLLDTVRAAKLTPAHCEQSPHWS